MEFINSIARIRSRFSIIFKHFVAAFAPIETWSSLSVEVGIESTGKSDHGRFSGLRWSAIVGIGGGGFERGSTGGGDQDDAYQACGSIVHARLAEAVRGGSIND